MFVCYPAIACKVDSYGEREKYHVILDTKDGVQEIWSESDLSRLFRNGVLNKTNFINRVLDSPDLMVSIGKDLCKNLKINPKDVSYSIDNVDYSFSNLHSERYNKDIKHIYNSSMGAECLFFDLGQLFSEPMYIRLSDGTECTRKLDFHNKALNLAYSKSLTNAKNAFKDGCFSDMVNNDFVRYTVDDNDDIDNMYLIHS